MGWHPRAEDVLWKPEVQEVKYSQTGGRNVRYKRGLKKELVDELLDLIHEQLRWFVSRTSAGESQEPVSSRVPPRFGQACSLIKN